MHEFSSLDLQGPRARPVSQTKTLHKDLSECLLQSLQSREQKSTDSTSQTLAYDGVQHYNTCIERVYAGYRHSRTGMQKAGIYNLELRHPRCVCNIRYGQGSQTQQCILNI